MEIRQLKREELGEAARVVRGAFATVAAEFGLTEENCPTNGAFLPEGRLEAQFDAGAFDGDVMIGFAALDLSDAEKPELEKLSVLPQSRHQGAGKLLVGWAAEQARAAGAAALRIGIIEENVRLRTWYEGLGFVHTGTRVFAHLPFTVGFMELPI
ncbi:MAG: GNAT family N-acetyltransferase [Candidatus Spyradocola sp.]|nr:GNAT family N-acetyltransferase [Candidatus Spyradocola sp.]